MKVWLVRDLEPTPLDEEKPRLLRAGMLSATLAAHGHDVTWFTSSFNHYSRRHRSTGSFRPLSNLSVRVLKGSGYRSKIGLARIYHNHRFARLFLKTVRGSTERPDVILADLPTTEAASAAVRFGLEAGVPTIVTIRDLWPDFFADFVRPVWRPLARLGLRPLDKQARFACKHASSLIGISNGYLKWGQEKGGRRSELDRVFHLGYPRSRVRSPAEIEGTVRKLDIPSSAKVVSFVGSWGSTYDLGLVLEAARLLRDRKDIVFVLAGNSTDRRDLEKAFRELSNVRLPGWLDRDMISALLSRSEIGLLPYAKSAPQGLPNKIFEYMAYGLFQIATLPGEAKELLETTATGMAIPPACARELANAIERALEVEDFENQRSGRRAIFEQRFEANKIYDELIDHIASVVEAHRLSPDPL